MTNYSELLAQKPRSNSINASDVRALLTEAGLTKTGELDRAALGALAEDVGVSPDVIREWASGSKVAEWRDLSALALALDRHPVFVRRVPPTRGIRGPWVITTAAVEDYRGIVGKWIDADNARDDLAQMAQETVQSARIPRNAEDGTIVFRGPKPLRLSLIVKAAWKADDSPALVAVRPTHEGIHVTIERGGTEGYNPEHYRNWLGAWLSRAFNARTSVALGEESVVAGFDPGLLDTAWTEYKESVRKQIEDAGDYLMNAVGSWRGKADRGEFGPELERHANDARAAAVILLEARKTHPNLLRLKLGHEASVRRLAESDASSWHHVLKEHQSQLRVCGRDVREAWKR